MDYGRALGALFVGMIGVMAAVACSDSEPADVPGYGQPNGLKQKPEGPTGTGSSGGSSSGSSSGGASGSSSGSSSGGATTQVACQTSGGTIVDGGPCAVSFTNDIFPKMQSGGTWGCMGPGACHGGSATPPITGTAAQVYAGLANFTTINSLPYFNPCSTAAAQSTFECNVGATTPLCGTGGQMPLGVPIADAGVITTWVACGAPMN